MATMDKNGAQIQFFRSKLVTISLKNSSILSVRGIIEDDIYGLEVFVEIDIGTMQISNIEGRWIRPENSQCFRAIPVLKESIGLKIEGESEIKLLKIVGRKGCRHFSELVWDCIEAAIDFLDFKSEQEKKDKKKELQAKELFAKCTQSKIWPRFDDIKSELKASTLIDMHIHTYPASPCSSMSVEDAIERAKSIGLDGICLTDHNHIWPAERLLELRRRYEFLILGGCEFTTDQGDVLAYFLPELAELLTGLKRIVPLRELRDILGEKGFLVAAHPFRGFLTFGVGMLELSLEQATKREIFRWVDGLEVLNVKVGESENSFASAVADAMNKHPVAGSDAHELDEVGRFGTLFYREIKDEKDLLECLKSGRYSPVLIR
jgi:predicted metal-dependent phosphoesterase TrpH